jgi:uncharacterized protein (TIGR03066 family)
MLVQLLVGLLLLTPAGVPVDDKIDAKLLVGKWEPESRPDGVDKMVVEFTKDNKVTLDIEAQGNKQKIEGTYKVDGNKISIKIMREGQEIDQTRKITKLTENELVTKDEEMNQERKYKKVK